MAIHIPWSSLPQCRLTRLLGSGLHEKPKKMKIDTLTNARPVVKSWRLSLRAWTAGGVGFWTRLKIWDILISYNVYIYVYITLWLWLRYAAQSDSLSAFITIDLQVQNTDHDFHGDRMRPECHPHVGNLHLCLDFTKPIKAIWKFDENGIIYI